MFQESQLPSELDLEEQVIELSGILFKLERVEILIWMDHERTKPVFRFAADIQWSSESGRCLYTRQYEHYYGWIDHIQERVKRRIDKYCETEELTPERLPANLWRERMSPECSACAYAAAHPEGEEHEVLHIGESIAVEAAPENV